MSQDTPTVSIVCAILSTSNACETKSRNKSKIATRALVETNISKFLFLLLLVL